MVINNALWFDYIGGYFFLTCGKYFLEHTQKQNRDMEKQKCGTSVRDAKSLHYYDSSRDFGPEFAQTVN